MKLLEHQGKQPPRPGGARRVPRRGGAGAERGRGDRSAPSADASSSRRRSRPASAARPARIRFADAAAQAQQAAGATPRHGDRRATRSRAVLVEQAVQIARELYAAVLDDPASKGPLLLFSAEGGMDIEEVNADAPEQVLRLPIDIRPGSRRCDAAALLSGTELTEAAQAPSPLP